jgi:uncharacterized protein
VPTPVVSASVTPPSDEHRTPPHGAPGHLDLSRIAQDLQIRRVQVESVVRLLDEGNTIPFITRYRKEVTGGLDEEVLRIIAERVALLRQLADRKQTILRSIDNQGRLTPELRAAILAADNPKRLEDLYLPYKPKKRTLAITARERGLEPLALAVWYGEPAAANLAELLPAFVNSERELHSPDDVLLGVQHILAEIIAEAADVRAGVRAVLWDTGKLCTSKSEKLAEGQGLEYKDYFAFTEPIRHIPPHRILAINRGEKENALAVRLEWDAETGLRVALDRLPLPVPGSVVDLPPLVLPPAPVAVIPPGPETPQPDALAPAPAEAHKPEAPAKEADPEAHKPEAPATEADPEAHKPEAPAKEANPEAHKPEAPAKEADPEAHKPEAPAKEADPDEAHKPEAPAKEANPEAHKPEAPAKEADPSLALQACVSPTPSAPAEAAPASPVAGAPGSRPPVANPPAQREPHLSGSPAPPPARSPAPLPAMVPQAPVVPLPQRAEALAKHPHGEFLRGVTADALARLLVPSLEREIRRELTQRAEGHAVAVFARNLRSKLLAPPLRGRRVLAIDPGFRTGCKLAVLDEHGNLLEDGIIYPHGSNVKKAEARARLEELVRKHQVHVIALGNGTACRETEEIVSEVIGALDTRRHLAAAQPPTPAAVPPVPDPVPDSVLSGTAATGGSAEAAGTLEMSGTGSGTGAMPVAAQAPTGEPVPQPATLEAAPAAAAPPPPPSAPPLPEALPELAYVIVNEAGASVYSASPVGREEFPHYDATLRGTISIGRRLQDPLSELVKIEPQHVGVGLYQHDVSPRQLRESLESVVASCVNAVGVDLNTASVPLLRHVSGLNAMVARDLVEYRKAHGPFTTRDQLLQVPGIGPARFVQAAGFLKLTDSANPLDGTWIHPESYPVAQRLLEDLGCTPEVLRDKQRLEELRLKLKALSPEEVAARLHTGLPTLCDIIDALARPGRDPREDLPPPVFKKGILRLEDLQPGMELKGTVLNVVDFGAFVDVGLKDSGLVHISQMANRFVKCTYDVVAVGDVVTVWVLKVETDRHRVSLTMIPPGTERRPTERRPHRPPRAAGEGQGPPPGQGEPREQRRGPPRGRGPQPSGDRPPPRGRGRPAPGRGARTPAAAPVANAPGTTASAPAEGSTAALPPPQRQPQRQPPPPPRKPRRAPHKPNLSQAALAGAAPLGTFAELAAFWEAKKKEDEPQPVPPAPPAAGEEGSPPSA